MSSDTKTCGKCKKIKPKSEFHKRGSSEGSVLSTCKQCYRLRNGFDGLKTAKERRQITEDAKTRVAIDRDVIDIFESDDHQSMSEQDAYDLFDGVIK